MSDKSELAVRAYLEFLDDPSSLRDEDAIAAAEAEVADAPDPMAKLRAIAKLERLKSVDGTACRKAFIAHARTFASANDIPASAWIAMGVPKDDLAEAGIVSGGGTTAPRRSARSRVTQEQVMDVARSMPDAFSIGALAEAAGTTLQTATKAIRSMEDSGTVVCVGPDANHTSRGRAPMLYRIK